MMQGLWLQTSSVESAILKLDIFWQFQLQSRSSNPNVVFTASLSILCDFFIHINATKTTPLTTPYNASYFIHIKTRHTPNSSCSCLHSWFVFLCVLQSVVQRNWCFISQLKELNYLNRKDMKGKGRRENISPILNSSTS